MADLHYDAFISYRHGGVDQYVAEQIHKKLETFKLPASIVKDKKKKGEKTKIERVFRDQEELPLSDNLEGEIVKALECSDNLIVVCTPRFSESIWCLKEVDTFIKLHGRKNVYAVLVEGEPNESFPKQLLVDDKGEFVEPLAADFRGKNKKTINKKMQTELLRLVAPMFGLNFDDLRQRHRERKAKAAFRMSLLVATISLAFAGICGFLAVYMAKSNELIMEQNNEIIMKNSEITSQNELIEANNEKLLYNQALSLAKDSEDLLESGDRFGAIEKAYQSLTEYEGNELPYTAEGQRALTSALMCYNSGYYYSSKYLMNTYGTVSDVKISSDGKYMMAIDNSNTIFVYEVENCRKVYEDHNIQTGTYPESDSAFIDEHTICYFNENNRFTKVNLQTGSQYFSEEEYDGNGQVFSSGDDYVAVGGIANTTVYNSSDMSEIFSSSVSDVYEGFVLDRISFDTFNDTCIVIYSDYFDGASETYIYDLSTGELLETIYGKISKLEGGIIDKDCIYFVYTSYKDVNASYFVECIDKSDYSTKWVQETYGGDSVQATIKDDLLILNYQRSASFIDINTGELIDVEIFDDNCLATRINNDFAFFYFDNGMVTYYDCVNREFSAFSMQYMKDSGIVEYKPCAGGFAGYKDNTIGVTYYSKIEPVDYHPTDYEDDVLSTQTDTLEDTDASNEAQALGLEKYYIAYRITYSPNYNIAIINYSDGSIDTFDLKKKQVIDHVENILAVYHSDGLDANGNEYFSFAIGGMAINPEGKVITVMDEYVGLSDDGKNVIIIGNFGDYKYANYPIFTVEELTTMAEFALETYSN